MATLLPGVDRAALTDEFGADMAASFGDALRVAPDVLAWLIRADQMGWGSTSRF